MTDAWTRRLARARVLQEDWPFAEEILSFYRRIAALQRDIATGAGADGLTAFIDPLLDLVASEAPEILAREAASLRALTPDARRRRILPGGPDRWWANRTEPLPFFTRVLLQPWLESAPRERAATEPASTSCPWCGCAPRPGAACGWRGSPGTAGGSPGTPPGTPPAASSGRPPG